MRIWRFGDGLRAKGYAVRKPYKVDPSSLRSVGMTVRCQAYSLKTNVKGSLFGEVVERGSNDGGVVFVVGQGSKSAIYSLIVDNFAGRAKNRRAKICKLASYV